MSVEELCAAAITQSDNTAANLLHATIRWTHRIWAHTGGWDDPARSHRVGFKRGAAGRPRDTTTPVAMLSNQRKLVLGDALLSSSKARLTEWLIDNKTGGNRLPAGLPTKWKVGDKTGSGDRGTTNAVAIVRPPDGAPILVSGYLAEQRWRAISAI